MTLDTYPSLKSLLARQIEATPGHKAALGERFANKPPEHLAVANEIADFIVALAGERLDRFLQDYDWICKLVLAEELHFRRTGRYRLKTFEQAQREVYSNADLMSHYMNGLLMTQLWWSNHTEAVRYYIDEFLGKFSAPFDHLEIGPGHGLLLLLTGRASHCATLEGWDVSQESVDQTKSAIERSGGRRDVVARTQDLFADAPLRSAFDSIALSEVLEHLEHPREALTRIKKLMNPEGRLFINMPINSPAPDHLFLLDTPEEVVDFVEKSGFRIEQSRFLPQTNMTLEKARRTKSTITTLIIARPD